MTHEVISHSTPHRCHALPVNGDLHFQSRPRLELPPDREVIMGLMAFGFTGQCAHWAFNLFACWHLWKVTQHKPKTNFVYISSCLILTFITGLLLSWKVTTSIRWRQSLKLGLTPWKLTSPGLINCEVKLIIKMWKAYSQWQSMPWRQLQNNKTQSVIYKYHLLGLRYTS
jgi:hypothetical protein